MRHYTVQANIKKIKQPAGRTGPDRSITLQPPKKTAFFVFFGGFFRVGTVHNTKKKKRWTYTREAPGQSAHE
jgi:hypothetical protein